MGSFNVPCTLTKTSISPGDRVVLFLMASPTGGSVIFYSGRPTYSSSRDVILTPLYLPIRGRYDDYGNIDFDEDSKEYKHFEGKIGFSPEEILDYAQDPRSATQQMASAFPHGFYPVYIREEAYDQAVKFVEGKRRENISLSATALGYFGFTQNANMQFFHSRDRSIFFEDNPHYCFDIVKNNDDGVEEFRITGISNLKTAASIYNSISKDNYIDDGELSKSFIEVVKLCQKAKHFVQRRYELISRGQSTVDAERSAYLVSGLKDKMRDIIGSFPLDAFMSAFAEELAEKNFIKEFENYYNFKYFCFMTHTMIAPLVYGPQFGEPDATAELALITGRISQEKKASEI